MTIDHPWENDNEDEWEEEYEEDDWPYYKDPISPGAPHYTI